MTKTSFPKVITVVVVLLVCGTALGVVIWCAIVRTHSAGDVPSSDNDKPQRQSRIMPAPADPALSEFKRQVGLLVEPDVSGKKAEITSRILSVGMRLREDPELADALTKQILDKNDPDECKFQILALGVSQTEQAKACLLEILVSDAASKIKMLAAAAYALASPDERVLRLPLPNGGMRVNVKAIDSEVVLEAIRVEWQHTEDKQASQVFFDLLELSAGNSRVAAEALWSYILEGRYKSEVLRRAADVASSLKSNAQTQTMLVEELLNQDNEELVRLAAARILKEQSVPTLEENTKTLVSAAKDNEADMLVRGYAFLGMDSSIRNQIDFKGLNSIIGSGDLPDDIRLSAIKEVRRRAQEIRAESGRDE